MPNKTILYILILLLTFSSNTINAQEMTVYDENSNLEIEFKYDPYKPDNSLPNFFINELSDAQTRMRSFFKYYIKAQSSTQLIKNGNQYRLHIKIDSFKTKGNFEYKDFNFSKACLPEKVFYSYNIYENNTKKIQNRNITLNIYSNSYLVFDSTFIDIIGNASYTIKKEKLGYIFSKNQKENFYKSINYIKLYYKDGQKIKEINKDIAKLDASNIDKLLLQSIDIKYINKYFNKISIPEYKSYLSLSKTDPAGIYKEYLSTGAIIDSLYQLYISKINVLDSLYYAKGMLYKEDNNKNKALEYFEKSIDFSPEYLPSLYELALNEYNNKQYSEAGLLLNNILQISSKNKKANILALNNYNAMLQQGIELNNTERYTEGLRILEEAKVFCTTNIHVLSCESYQDSAINYSRYGIYKSYISIASASMRRGRLDMTEDYLGAASKYQDKYPEAIKSNKKAKSLYSLLITQYLRLSIESASDKQQANAYLHHADSIALLYSLDDAESFIAKTKLELEKSDFSKDKKSKKILAHNKLTEQQEYSTIIIEDISPEKTAINSYNLYIKLGISYYENNKFARAYSKFKSAKLIEQEFNVKLYDSLDYFIHISSRNSVLKLLEKANLNAWAKRYNSAEILLEEANIEIKENKLESDSLIELALKQLEDEIKTKENSILSKHYNKLMNKARLSIDFSDFASMKKYCDTAIYIAEENRKIALNISYPKSLLQKYTYEIKYQLLEENTKDYCNEQAYKQAIEEFKNTVLLRDSMSVQINIFALKDFANYANSIDIYKYTIQTALEQSKEEIAFEIWKIANTKSTEINKETAKLCMQALGRVDIKKYPNSNKKQLYIARFGVIKSFKNYKRYYYKGLKNEIKY